MLTRAALIGELGMSAEQLAALEERADQEVTAAFEAALEAPFPQPQETAHA